MSEAPLQVPATEGRNGEFSDAWVAELSARIQRRVEIAKLADRANDKQRQQILKACKADPIGWIRDWVWTLDPRLTSIGLPASIPFDLWLKQEEIIRSIQDCLTDAKDLCILKSRDTGVSWVVMGFVCHQWLFVPGFAAGVGTRSLDLLDSLDDPKSLFQKVRHILKWLPRWMLPNGWDPRKHDNLKRIVNPQNGSSISGEVGENMGRGGRTSLYVADEFAFVKSAEQVVSSLSYNTRTAVYLSNPSREGPANEFTRMVQGGRYRVAEIGWEDDPRKTRAWYENECSTRDPVTIAVELDRDLTGAAGNTIIPGAWIKASQDLARKIKATGPDPSWTVLAGLDVATTGSDESVLAVTRGPYIEPLDTWTGADTSISSDRVVGRLRAYPSCVAFRFDDIGVGAGIAGAMRERREIAESKGSPLPYQIIPVNVGKAPPIVYLPDDPDRLAGERFANLRAFLWWTIRLRFFRTFEFITGAAAHPIESLIAIPDDPILVAQLTAPKIEYRSKGSAGEVLAIESKQRMRARGVRSPDRANAIMIALATDVEAESDFAFDFI